MKVTEHIQNAQGKTLFSFEILPPLKGSSIQTIFNTLDPLMEFNPSYINVTYHRSEFIFKKTPTGLFEKKMVSKRPGTAGICASIQTKYKVDAVPHLICGGFTVDETEDLLIELNFLDIHNVLLIRGDKTKNEHVFTPEDTGHKHAIDLVNQVTNMNKGNFLEQDLKNVVPTDFCIGVSGYPEKHHEAPNMATDLRWLKAKVEAGADYIVTQMFFDNKKFFAFVEECRKAGITIPIIPGLKPITGKKQIESLPRTFSIDIPDDLHREFEKCVKDEDFTKVGTEWCTMQSKELLKSGVPVLHYYTMSNPVYVQNVVKELI